MEEINHDDLFSGSSLILGKIHWYIQKADTEMDKKMQVQPDKSKAFDFKPITLTDFGKDVGYDYIYWWIFQKEEDNTLLMFLLLIVIAGVLIALLLKLLGRQAA